jgi:hypothetical protein
MKTYADQLYTSPHIDVTLLFCTEALGICGCWNNMTQSLLPPTMQQTLNSAGRCVVFT